MLSARRLLMQPNVTPGQSGPLTTPSLRTSGILIAAGVAIFAAPARFEGPVLLPISPGHAISAVDTLGVASVSVGSLLYAAALWRRRVDLGERIRSRPSRAMALIFGTGLGMGLLLASALSVFWWWWAIGAALLLLSCYAVGRSL